MDEVRRINYQIDKFGTAFTTSMLTDQEAFYDFRAVIYDDQNEVPQRKKRRQIIFGIYHKILKRCLKDKKVIYLDFGCGTGFATLEFIKLLNSYFKISQGFAIDVSKEMVNIAKSCLPKFNIRKGSVNKILTQNKFDLITAFFHVLCHLSETELNKFFENTFVSLKRNGFVCFDVIKQFDVGEHGYTQRDKEGKRKYIAYRSLKKDSTIITDRKGNSIIGTDRMFSKKEIIDFARKYKFKIVTIEEVKIENPDPKIGFLKEFAVILQKD